MAIDGWGADYPSASNFITNRFRCNASFAPSAGFCVRAIDRMIDRATRERDSAAAGAKWAEIDRAIVDEPPYVRLMNAIAVELVSERVGNYVWNLQWGSLLNLLWVR